MKKLILLLSIVLSTTVLSAQNEEYIKTYHQYLKESQMIASIDSTFSKVFSVYRKAIPKEDVPPRVLNKIYKKAKIRYVSIYQDSLLSTYYRNFSIRDLQDFIGLYKSAELKTFMESEPKICAEMASRIAELQVCDMSSFNDSISIWKQTERHERILIHGSKLDSLYRSELQEYMYKIGNIEEILVNSLKVAPGHGDEKFEEEEIKRFIPHFLDHTIYPIYYKYLPYESFHYLNSFFRKTEHRHFPLALRNIYHRMLEVSYEMGEDIGKEIYEEIQREGYTISIDIPN